MAHSQSNLRSKSLEALLSYGLHHVMMNTAANIDQDSAKKYVYKSYGRHFTWLDQGYCASVQSIARQIYT